MWAAHRADWILNSSPPPRLTSATIDGMTGAKVFFKPENLQRMGAFKFRGALNALMQLGADERRRGVLAFSSGNHAQAVALSGKLLGVPATIVMPTDAPKVKLEATRGYGAEVVLYDASNEDRQKIAEKLATERNDPCAACHAKLGDIYQAMKDEKSAEASYLKAIEVAGYINAIAGKAPEPFNFRAGLRIQSLVETIQASSAAQQWLDVK